MSKQSVLDALRFWEPSAWTYRTDGVPTVIDAAGVKKITEAIDYLYDNSPTVRGYLDWIVAQTGSIRIGGTKDNAYFAPPRSETGPTGSVTISDPYIMLDPDILIYGIKSEGVLFELSFAVIIAHELSHWRNRTADVGDITNAAMNSPSYDYVGDTVRDEWAISTELGITDRRATYQATIMPQDHRFSYFDLNSGPVSDTVGIVRLGNVDEDNQGHTIVNDVINYTGRYESTLTFAFSGDDIVDGSAGQDSSPDDRIFWNGRQLLGGQTQIIDLELTDHSFGVIFWSGIIDSQGVVYTYYKDDGYLMIDMLDADVFVGDWQNGDLGITLDMIEDVEVVTSWDQDGNLLYWYSNVPATPIVLNGVDYDIYNLPTWNNPGLLLEPIHPLA